MEISTLRKTTEQIYMQTYLCMPSALRWKHVACISTFYVATIRRSPPKHGNTWNGSIRTETNQKKLQDLDSSNEIQWVSIDKWYYSKYFFPEMRGKKPPNMTKSWNTAKRQLATCPSYPHEIKNCSYIVKWVKCQSWRGKHPHIISKCVPEKNLDNKSPEDVQTSFLLLLVAWKLENALVILTYTQLQKDCRKDFSAHFYSGLVIACLICAKNLNLRTQKKPFLIKVGSWTQGSSCRVAVNPRVFLATFVLWL